ncbi:hypothetical protein BH11PLA1_BH11PLA1_08800 [soil metagenome]
MPTPAPISACRARLRRTFIPASLLSAALLAAPIFPSTLPLLARAATTAATASKKSQPLDREVEALIAKNKMSNADVGVYIVDVDTGSVLAAIKERSQLIPASNLKLLSTGAAALTLGKDYNFRTTIHLLGDRLIITGSGDPALADPELLRAARISLEDFLDNLIRPILDRHTSIREIIVDDRAFDRDMICPTWPDGDQRSRWYCAPVSGLNFHTNIIEVFPRPASVGAPASLRKVPDAPWIEITNKTRTISGKGSTALSLQQMPGATGEEFSMAGTILAPLQEPLSAALHDPARVFGRLIADRLTQAGVNTQPSLTPPVTPPLAQPTSTHESAAAPLPAPFPDANLNSALALQPPPSFQPSGLPAAPAPISIRTPLPDERFDLSAPAIIEIETPLAAVLRRCNVDSYNLYAEALLKAAGHAATGQPGSWSNGTAVVRTLAAQRAPDAAADLIMVDGSGLSSANALSPMLLGQWLAAVARDPSVGTMFIQSLATPGEGTLKKRFLRRPPAEIRAKSGFISNVQCLSGFIIAPSGRRLAFVVLCNKLNAAQGSAKALHEDIVQRAAEWLSRQPGL